MTEKKKLDKELKELILWRLETSVPLHFRLSAGGKGTFSKEKLRKHVEQEDEIGLAFADMQLNFIKSLSCDKFLRFWQNEKSSSSNQTKL